MKKTSPKISTSIRLDIALRKKVNNRLNERKYGPDKITFDAAVHEALELWLAAQQAKPQLVKVRKPSGSLSVETRKYLQMCLRVLGCNDPDVLNAIMTNLKVFYRYAGGDPDAVEPIEIES